MGMANPYPAVIRVYTKSFLICSHECPQTSDVPVNMGSGNIGDVAESIPAFSVAAVKAGLQPVDGC